MGKASRMKKVNRMAMADRPGFHKDASRQARERRQEEVNQHNAAFEATLAELNEFDGLMFSSEDGVLPVDKKMAKALYDSWLGNEIANDDTSQLGVIAAMGPKFRTSIWEAEVVIVYSDIEGQTIFNPLMAAFVLDKSQCFAWLLEHAFAHAHESIAVTTDVLQSVLMNADKFDPKSVRYANARLLLRVMVDYLSDDNRQAVVDKMAQPGVDGAVANMVGEYFAERAANEEHCEIESFLTPPAAGLLANGNPHAIGLGHVAVNDPEYDGQSHGSATSGAKRL